MKEVKDSICALREDAIARGMQELAIVYGWSAIRLSEQILQRKMSDVEMYRLAMKVKK